MKRKKIEETNKRVNVPVTISGRTANALIDTGSTLTHISENLSKLLKSELTESSQKFTLATSDSYSKSLGMCQVNLKLLGQEYKSSSFSVSATVVKNLITDVILGRDFMTQHQSIKIHFGGVKPSLQLGALEAVKTSTPVKLFQYLYNDCRLIATKERRYSWQDNSFISSEIKQLLADDLIEPSNSPWRSQPLLVTQDDHKKGMVIDYTRTINKFTFVNSYPFPKMHDVVQKVARYKIYSRLDMSSAYHQVEIPACDRMYTAFQAKGSL